jgi:hypothetical protein
LLLIQDSDKPSKLAFDQGFFPIYSFQKSLPALTLPKALANNQPQKIVFAQAFASNTQDSYYTTPDFVASLVYLHLQTVQRFVRLYETKPAFGEMFGPLHSLLCKLVDRICVSNSTELIVRRYLGNTSFLDC